MHTLSKTLTSWKARRAGGRITIVGTNQATGGPDKIVGVDRIEPGEGVQCIAVDKDNVSHVLLI